MKKEIKIVDYRPAHRLVFKEMNQRWIEKYFKMEASDHKALDDPEQSVLCLLYTSPSPRDGLLSRMPSSA